MLPGCTEEVSRLCAALGTGSADLTSNLLWLRTHIDQEQMSAV